MDEDNSAYKASCHCGRVEIGIAALPEFIMDCNCSLCASHGALWGYYAPDGFWVTGETRTYQRADREASATTIHFCGHCGSTTHFAAKAGEAEMIGANMRLFEPALIKGIELRFGDGRSWSGEGPWDYRRDHGVVE